MLGTNTASPYDDATAAPGTNYYYWVRAQNAVCTSDFGTADAGLMRLAPPRNVAASDSLLDRVVVAWNPVVNATNYAVLRNANSLDTNTASVITQVSAAVTSVTDLAVGPSTGYTYWVRANNSASTSEWSAPDIGCLWAASADGTRYVWTNSPSPGGGYTNWVTAAHDIQSAVNAATNGERVLVTNGLYLAAGSNTLGMVMVDKAIAVRSVNGPAVTVVNGNGFVNRGFYLNHSSAVVDGFGVVNGNANGGAGGGMYINAGAMVTNCVFSGCYANQGGGMYCASGTNLLIANCRLWPSGRGQARSCDSQAILRASARHMLIYTQSNISYTKWPK